VCPCELQRNIDLCACLAIDIHTSEAINFPVRSVAPKRSVSVYSTKKLFNSAKDPLTRFSPIYFDFTGQTRQAQVDINCHQFLIWANKFRFSTLCKL